MDQTGTGCHVTCVLPHWFVFNFYIFFLAQQYSLLELFGSY